MTEQFTQHWESATCNITCICGEEHILDSQNEPKFCKCGRRFSLFTRVNVEIKSGHLRDLPIEETPDAKA